MVITCMGTRGKNSVLHGINRRGYEGLSRRQSFLNRKTGFSMKNCFEMNYLYSYRNLGLGVE